MWAGLPIRLDVPVLGSIVEHLGNLDIPDQRAPFGTDTSDMLILHMAKMMKVGLQGVRGRFLRNKFVLRLLVQASSRMKSLVEKRYSNSV